MDRRVKGANELLKNQKKLAVPLYNGCSFCVRKQTKLLDKLYEFLRANQFDACNGESDHLTIKKEKMITSSLYQSLKQGKISEEI